MATRLLEVRTGVLNKNDMLAAALRERFQEAGVLTLNVVSSPGTGKTALLERTMATMVERGLAVAALVGDLETDNDAKRLARSGALVRQIETHGNCHLEAEWITTHIAEAGWDLDALDVLIIENVGNLVCPANYDLGEQVRAVLLSVTEGEDKPLKYPGMFHSSDVAVITKMDLAVACEFDLAMARENITRIRPEMPIFETSSRTGAGMSEWLDWLLAHRPNPLNRVGTPTVLP